MIQLDRVERRFGRTTLFSDLSWRILPGEHLGLVGPNGAGKTTLLRLLAEIDRPDEGQLIRPATSRVAYLAQEVEKVGSGTVLEVALTGMEELGQIEQRLQELERQLEAAPDDEALQLRYGDLRHRFEDLDGDRAESRARAVLSGLGVPEARFSEPLEHLSGGWRMRVALAKLLLGEPDLLLLDEPTNHLDLEAIDWLESFLAARSGAFIVVSHDRYFLNRLARGIVEMASGKLTRWSGNYDAYLEAKEQQRELLEKQAKTQARKRAETERFIERFRYKATKAKQVQSRVKQLEKQSSVETMDRDKRVRFGFPPAPRSGDIVVRVEDLAKRFDEQEVYRDANMLVRRGDRLAIVGPNGSGKSTLLKLLSGKVEPDAGEASLGHAVAMHYFAQHQLDELDREATVLETMRRVAPEQTPGKLRTLLGCFLFEGEAVDKKVAVLSGGEKARLALARMLVRPANLLLLDEPTNHLDLASREVLEEALNEYAGTLIVVSHDRYFMNRVATALIETGDRKLTRHEGDYDSLLERRATAGESPQEERVAAKQDRREAKRQEAEERNRRYREQKEREAKLGPVEQEIAELEQKVETLTAEQALPEVYADPEQAKRVAAALGEAQRRLEQCYATWESLAAE